MKVDRRKAETSLKTKGFQENRSGDHIYFHHWYKGRLTGVYTKLSHSSKIKVISGDLLLFMKKQLRLDEMREAVNLLDCTMDGDDYNRILADKSII